MRYYYAINLISEIAKDMGAHIPWGHLTPEFTSGHIKAILMDEHGSQVKGLDRYFVEKYPSLILVNIYQRLIR